MNPCPRQFSRRFRLEFNSSPAAFVQRLRLDEARKRLSGAGCTVKRVAASVGFHDPDSFRRAFMRRFGVAPTHYRSRFVAGAENCKRSANTPVWEDMFGLKVADDLRKEVVSAQVMDAISKTQTAESIR